MVYMMDFLNILIFHGAFLPPAFDSMAYVHDPSYPSCWFQCHIACGSTLCTNVCEIQRDLKHCYISWVISQFFLKCLLSFTENNESI